MSEDDNEYADEFEPISFDLASGDLVKVVYANFWAKVSNADQQLGVRSYKYWAIRFYSNEGTFPRRVVQVHEMVGDKDFEIQDIEKIWMWLTHHSQSQERFDHEDLDDFLAHLEFAMEEIDAGDEDMIEHLERLPSLTNPDDFDQIDDSIYTDQKD
jgi:hypothetical protein